MQERRAIPRPRTFLKGVLAFNNGNSSEDCIIRDLTEVGALIELSRPIAPTTFDLLAPSRSLRKRARMVWRQGKRFGLSFS